MYAARIFTHLKYNIKIVYLTTSLNVELSYTLGADSMFYVFKSVLFTIYRFYIKKKDTIKISTGWMETTSVDLLGWFFLWIL